MPNTIPSQRHPYNIPATYSRGGHCPMGDIRHARSEYDAVTRHVICLMMSDGPCSKDAQRIADYVLGYYKCPVSSLFILRKHHLPLVAPGSQKVFPE